jgi:hypothetical protein
MVLFVDIKGAPPARADRRLQRKSIHASSRFGEEAYSPIKRNLFESANLVSLVIDRLYLDMIAAYVKRRPGTEAYKS